MVTLGIFSIITAIILLIAGIDYITDYETGRGIVCTVLSVVSIIVAVLCISIGIHSNSFKRTLRDVQSNYSDGITRTISITAEDGREIYYYHGTIDIELNEEGRKIKFEDENGKRQIIIYGVQDTVTIIED